MIYTRKMSRKTVDILINYRYRHEYKVMELIKIEVCLELPFANVISIQIYMACRYSIRSLCCIRHIHSVHIDILTHTQTHGKKRIIPIDFSLKSHSNSYWSIYCVHGTFTHSNLCLYSSLPFESIASISYRQFN